METAAPHPHPDSVTLAVVDGELVVHTPPGATAAATLAWTDTAIEVTHVGARVQGDLTCTVAPGQQVVASVADVPAGNDYVVTVSPDKMLATMRVRQQPGRQRRLADAAPTTHL